CAAIARCSTPSPNTCTNRVCRRDVSRSKNCSRQARWIYREASMLPRRTFLLGTAALAFSAQGASAQAAYPSHPIKIIVPTPAGGPVDTMARIVAQAMQPVLGESLVIENRAGAGNTLGSKAAAIAEPDGYTLSYTAASGLIMSPMLY